MNKARITTFSLLLVVNLLTINYLPAIAESAKDEKSAKEEKTSEEEKVPDYVMDTSKIGESENGYIRSEQLLELGNPTAGSLSIEGEQSLRQGGLNGALTVLQRAVEMAPLDMDNRILYAQTLEKKLMMEKDKKDPKLFNFIVKQWYFVYKKAEFLDQSMLGLNHVMQLTGSRPKRFENARKFFARVLIPEDGSVKVALGGEKMNQSKAHLHKDISEDPDKDFMQAK